MAVAAWLLVSVWLQSYQTQLNMSDHQLNMSDHQLNVPLPQFLQKLLIDIIEKYYFTCIFFCIIFLCVTDYLFLLLFENK